MAGHGRSKNGVVSLAYVPAIHVLLGAKKDVDARHKAGHDGATVAQAAKRGNAMIDCYTWTTDNGYKPRMMLEETGLPHKIIPVNIREKAQMKPEFLKISPGHKIPAIVDHDGPGGTVTLCESGAIFKYLGEKSGKFYPSDAAARVKVDQWLFYGSATFTTLSQQFGTWVVRMPEKVPAPMKHYDTVIRDMLGTLDTHLATNEYVAGAYSIADMTMYPDVHLHGVKDIGLGDYPNLKRWHDAIEARPAIQRAWGPFPA